MQMQSKRVALVWAGLALGSTLVGAVAQAQDVSFQLVQMLGIGGGGNSFAVGDFNGDGVPDLAVANDGLVVLLGNGDGSFQAPLYLGPDGFSVAVGDFNGDGRLDLVVAGGGVNGNVSVFLGNGDGSFQPPRIVALGEYPRSVAVGDFNGDGWLDVVVVASGGVRVLLGNGDGSFQGPRPLSAPFASAVAVGDFNPDGPPALSVATLPSHTPPL